MQLKLDADWVVLSACNTAAGGKPGAEALSGLARAFFYAGARALLLSHWQIDSKAATRLATSTHLARGQQPIVEFARLIGQCQRKRWLPESFNVTRDQAVRRRLVGFHDVEREVHDAVVGER